MHAAGPAPDRVDNPPNPFVAARCEWTGAPPRVTGTVHEEPARSILTHNDSPDIPYAWSLNPYRGCRHACAYCFARCTHEYLGLGAGSDFDAQLIVKTNAPQLLETALRRPKWRREPIAFGSVTDCYQPLEDRYELTRQCLAVCVAHANPVGIVTKSDLVTRDLDLLAELQRRAGCEVWLSVTMADDTLARTLEPGAPPPSRRFAALQTLRAAGIPAGVLLAPIIPGLTDREVPAVLTRAAAAGATHANYTPVRLPGTVADVFLARLRRALPEVAARVEARIRDTHGGRLNDPRLGYRMEGYGPYWESVARLFETTATRLGLNSGPTWQPVTPPTPPAPRQLTLF